MVSFTAASVLGLAAIVSAQTIGLPAPAGQSCASSYSICTSSSTPIDTCNSQLTTCESDCLNKFDVCRAGSDTGSAAVAECNNAYAKCLGRDPFNGAEGEGLGANTTVYVTQVVPSYTTYCPGPTTFYNNGEKYVATGPGVVTVTNCPCTITKAVPGPTPVGNNGGNNTTPPYTPQKYTGGASPVVVAGLSAAAGLVGLFAFAL